jgi:hypothetical protein
MHPSIGVAITMAAITGVSNQRSRGICQAACR